MITRFFTPNVKPLQIKNFTTEDTHVQKRTYQLNQLIICVFVDAHPLYVVVIKCYPFFL